MNCDAEGVSLESARDPSVDESWEQHLWEHTQALTQTQREWFHCHSIWCTRPSVHYMAKTVNKAQGVCIINEQQSYRSHTSYLEHKVPHSWDSNVRCEINGCMDRHTLIHIMKKPCMCLYLWMNSLMNTGKQKHTQLDIQCIIKLTTWWCSVSSNPRFSDSRAL